MLNAFTQIFITPYETRIIPTSTNMEMRIREVNKLDGGHIAGIVNSRADKL